MTALENIKIAVALRTARTAIGWNQQEFADRLGVAKSTIARIETLETTASAVVLMRAIQLLNEGGVSIDFMEGPGIQFYVRPEALDGAAQRLRNEHLRRSDRKRSRDASDE